MFDNFKSVWYALRERHSILREEGLKLAKATKTIRQALHYPPQYAAYFAANQALFNLVVAFYFEVIQAHEGILALKNKEALTALEKLTHTTESNPNPITPLTDLAPDIPALFRRAAINAALGSARSFFSSLKQWRARKEKHEANQTKKGKSRPLGGGHQSRPDLGISPLSSTQAFGASVVPVLSCSRSGPARAGPGSKYTRSVAISPMVI